MTVLIDRALALNPSFARGWFQSGRIRLMAGQPDLSIEHVEASLRLSPRARVGFPFSVIGLAQIRNIEISYFPACAWRPAKGHDPGDEGESFGADAGEPAGGLDDCRYRAALSSLWVDDNRPAARLALQGTRS